MLLGEISKFAAKMETSSLKTIDIVVYDNAMIKDFEDQLAQTQVTKSVKQAFQKFMKKKTTKLATWQKHQGLKEENTLILNSIKLIIHAETIVDQECDIIVQKTTTSFELPDGEFPRHIYGARKDEIKLEISSLNDKLLRVTSSGIPKFKKIFHVAFPRGAQELKSAVLRIFNEVVKMGFNSVALSLEESKQVESILEAATEFDKENSNTGCCVTVNLIGIKSKVIRRLHDVVIIKGSALPGAKVQGRPTRNVIRLQLCCLRQHGNMEETIRHIESDVDNRYHKEFIKCNDIETVKLRRWEEIKDIGDTHKVQIVTDKEGNEDVIVIDGIKDGVFMATKEIQHILNKIVEAEKVMRLGSYYWEYKDLDGITWTAFEPLDNQALEELNQRMKNDSQSSESLSSMYVDGDKREFEVDLKKGELLGYRTVQIRRKEIEDFPAEWCDMGAETVRSVLLKQSDPDYKNVEEKFMKTMNQTTCTIQSITRIQNKTLYVVFETKRKSAKEDCKTEPLTRKLFHGTKSEVVKTICNVGFDRIHSGTRVGAKWGHGNYFAVDAKYSAKGYALADGNGVCTMILAEVITGDFCLGGKDYKQCPNKPWSKHMPYESLVDNINDPTIFVVFHDAGAYPSYVIKFKQTKP